MRAHRGRRNRRHHDRPEDVVTIQPLRDLDAERAREADPAAGSYYLEWLTDVVAREAWAFFQKIESAGGFLKAGALISGAVAQAREAKGAAVRSRRRTLVGTNQYPTWQEKAPGEPAAEGFRAARPFEELRQRTERSARRPRVFLAELGGDKMRSTRANFAVNFFGCAGFEIVAPGAFGSITETIDAAESAEPDLVVLCSSDAEYPALTREFRTRVSRPVVVAGSPPESLTAMGVVDFVHAKSDVVATLTAWQERLGI